MLLNVSSANAAVKGIASHNEFPSVDVVASEESLQIDYDNEEFSNVVEAAIETPDLQEIASDNVVATKVVDEDLIIEGATENAENTDPEQDIASSDESVASVDAVEAATVSDADFAIISDEYTASVSDSENVNETQASELSYSVINSNVVDNDESFETASAVKESELDESRGTFDAVSLYAASTGNTAINTVSGANSISESAFSNSSGVATLIQNSGNNVAIQSSTNVNVYMNSPVQ